MAEFNKKQTGETRDYKERFEFRFTVGNNSNGSTSAPHSSDGTGEKVFVIKEDEGAFYDAGLALKNNVSGSYLNPGGNMQDGAWSYLLPTVPAGALMSIRLWSLMFATE